MRARLGLAPAAATGTALVLLGAGFGFGRPDVAVAGAVLLVAAAAALGKGLSAHEPEVRVERRPTGGDAGTRVRISVTSPGSELVRLTGTVLESEPLSLAVDPRTPVTLRVAVAHTGEQDLVAVTATPIGADASLIGQPSSPAVLRIRVPPRTVRLPGVPLPVALGGRTGSHDSRRPGDGGEFYDIHPFAPGDRLRRIDWKATARLARVPGELFARRTLATADAHLALVLDDRDDLTGALGTWAAGDPSRALPTSLDIAREAAWSFAAGYLDLADQVSFTSISRPRGDVVRGSGARHRERIRRAITAAASGRRTARTRVPRVPQGAVIVLLSTFLDDDTAAMAARWRAGGHRVIAVDTLPALRPEVLRRAERIARRILLAEREERLRDLGATGVDVLRWDGSDGERAAALRALTRTRSVPRR